MINLLPHNKQAEIRAGRVNVIVRQYIIMVFVAFILLAGIVGATFVLLNNQRVSAERRFSESSERIAKYANIKTQAEAFRSELSIAKQVLDKEIVYSNLLLRIAESIPKGVVIDSLALDSTTLGTPVSMTAHAANKDVAVRLKERFQARTDLYSNVYFEELDFNSDGADNNYPITIRINVTISKEALR